MLNLGRGRSSARDVYVREREGGRERVREKERARVREREIESDRVRE